MKIEEMNEKRLERGFSYEQISRQTGIAAERIRDILDGDVQSAAYGELIILGRFFSDAPGALREPLQLYGWRKEQGEYTVEDYYDLPRDRRVELIDGIFYDMAAPSHIHQVIGGRIYRCLADHIDENGGKCVPVYAPLDVRLEQDDRTVLQPDVMVICDREKFQPDGAVCGAPDLVIEILSKSTAKKDSEIKLAKYRQTGVRECWLVDTDRKRVLVYEFACGGYPAVYGFSDTVPVGIFDGKCSVDFARIYESVRFLYEVSGSVA